jgi:hypothetical protein
MASVRISRRDPTSRGRTNDAKDEQNSGTSQYRLSALAGVVRTKRRQSLIEERYGVPTVGLDEARQTSLLWRHQLGVRRAYRSQRCQWCVAGLIMANFLANVIEKEMNPRGERVVTTLVQAATTGTDTNGTAANASVDGDGPLFAISYRQHAGWDRVDFVFTILFLLELLVNAYGSWFWLFWISGWNVFDVVRVWMHTRSQRLCGCLLGRPLLLGHPLECLSAPHSPQPPPTMLGSRWCIGRRHG